MQTMAHEPAALTAMIPRVFWGYCVYRTALLNILYWWQNDLISLDDAAQYMEDIARLALEE